ncbi:zona pellucida sperm-binding protein 3-like [Bufo bufo]|uniref:zona pellucida sperm-binding protein 3-like n=1 Tax=Bufo bufo TaxID=8384 RepID=UPI001ABEB345|nr:zona pellucida sperm-binding protein 3-like [Bufo bufo]
MEDRMVVTVMRDLYGIETLLNDSDVTLGPQSCGAGPQSTDAAVVFETGLQECGNSLQMTPDGLLYGTNLTFKPMSGAQNMPISDCSPAVVPIQCYYPRYGNVSSQAIKPTWFPFSSTVSSEEQLVFSLRLMTEDWSAPRPSLVFSLGDVFYIKASLEGENHVSMILFIDSCVATTSPDPSSSPRYEIIAYSGCLVDGTLHESSSAFRSPRPQQDQLQFMVDAFQLVDSQASMIYITCSLRAAAATQVPDPMNKACSYNKTSNSWSTVEGPSDICQCCNTQDCAALYGESRGWDPSYGRPRPRAPGKRQIGQGPWLADRQALASVGPLLVLGGQPRRSLAVPGSSTMETWILGGVSGLGFVVVLICGAVIGRSMKKKGPPPDVEE